MRAVVIEKNGEIRIRDVAKPVPSPYQALIKTEVVALCNATDSKLIARHFPGIGPEQYPLVLGHETAGIVCEVGEKATSFKVGDRVISAQINHFAEPGLGSGWGGFCDYVLACDHDAMVRDGVADAAHGWFDLAIVQRPVAADVQAEEAVLLCTWREVYGGIGDFNLQPGQKVLIYGGGPVGLSFAKFCKLLGLGWIGLVDRHAEKRALALKMGADEAFSPEEIAAQASGLAGSLDAVVDAIGREELVNGALPLIKLGGTIGVYGVISADTLTLQKSRGPMNFNLIVHQWPTRLRERAALEPLTGWIREGKLSASEFVTHRFPIEEINQGVAEIRAGRVVKCLLKF